MNHFYSGSETLPFRDSVVIESSLFWSYEDMIDHRNYARNLSSCEIKAWKFHMFT